MWTLLVTVSVVLYGQVHEQTFRHNDKFATEQACYDKASADRQMMLNMVKEMVGEVETKITPTCVQDGRPA